MEMKVMDLVSEAHFPAHLSPSWLVLGAYINVVAQGGTEKVASRVKGS